MAKTKFEILMEKAGIFVSDEEKEATSNTAVPISSEEQDATQSFNLQSVGEANEAVQSDVIAQAYSVLPDSEDDIVMIVEKLLKNFEMLPDSQKPAVVVSTLETMGKNVERFIMEAETKKTALANAITKYSQKITNDIAKLDAVIKEAEKEISRCRQEQLDKTNKLEEQKKTVAEETKRLEKIIKILGGK